MTENVFEGLFKLGCLRTRFQCYTQGRRGGGGRLSSCMLLIPVPHATLKQIMNTKLSGLLDS